MTKRSKKNVKDIQSALLSKTGFLKQDENIDTNDDTDNNQSLLIDADILEKLKALAEYENTDLKDLVNKALNHFLRLKSLQVTEAMKAKE